jgi:endonuclease YncB( thermonuclease family)
MKAAVVLGTLFLAVLFALTVSPSAAAEPMDKNCVSDPETATVGEVIDGETLNLSDGRIVRLIGAKAPPLPLSWRGDEASRSGVKAGARQARVRKTGRA